MSSAKRPSLHALSLVSRAFHSVRRSNWKSSWNCSPDPTGGELGYHVTLVKDATAAFSREAMHAAHEINGPTYAHEIATTSEIIAALSKA